MELGSRRPVCNLTVPLSAGLGKDISTSTPLPSQHSPPLSLPVLLDTGAGLNLLPAHVIPELVHAGVAVHVHDLPTPSIAILADNTTHVTLSSPATFDITDPVTAAVTPITFFVAAAPSLPASVLVERPVPIIGWP